MPVQLLLKFKPDVTDKTADSLRLFFFHDSNPYDTPQIISKTRLLIENDEVFYPIDQRPNFASHELLVSKSVFNEKLLTNQMRFELDESHIKLTLARSVVAGGMTHCHGQNLRNDLQPEPDNVDKVDIDWSIHGLGVSCLVPVAMLMYLSCNYGHHYYKTGECLLWDDPIFQQMRRDCAKVGVQTLFIAVSFTLARVAIPFLLHMLSLQPSGPAIHLIIAPIFGFIYASSLLLYDLIARQTEYGQLTGSPYRRFTKNIAIGTGLYLVQLLPFLEGLSGVQEFFARSACAFVVPNTVNLLTVALSSLRSQKTIHPAPVEDTQAKLAYQI